MELYGRNKTLELSHITFNTAKDSFLIGEHIDAFPGKSVLCSPATFESTKHSDDEARWEETIELEIKPEPFIWWACYFCNDFEMGNLKVIHANRSTRIAIAVLLQLMLIAWQSCCSGGWNKHEASEDRPVHLRIKDFIFACQK